MADEQKTVSVPGVTFVRELGRGKHGVVYEGNRNGQAVAIKVAHREKPDVAKDSYFREATALARAAASGLPKVYDVGLYGAIPYLVLEKVEGTTIKDALAQNGRFAPHELLGLAKGLLATLQAVHRAGLLHRDISAENVILTQSGQPRLIDFGLSGASGDEKVSEVVGSLAYTAPEIPMSGGGAADVRSDLYSLGVLLFECAAGRLPFVATDPNVLIREHATRPPPSLRELAPQLPQHWDVFVAKLLKKSPEDRFQTAEDALANLIPQGSDAGAEPNFKKALQSVLPSRQVDQPLLGRAREVEKLLSVARRRGTNQAGLVVVGDTGVGKTRLLVEVAMLVTSEDVACLWLSGTISGVAPFLALKSGFEKLVSGWKFLSEKQRKVEEAKFIESAGPFLEVVLSVAPSLAASLNLAAPVRASTASGDVATDALATVLSRYATRKGQLYVFIDNMDNIDSASLQVIDTALRRSDGIPLVVLGNSKQESWIPGLATLELTPLSDDAARQMAAGFLGTQIEALPAPLLKTLSHTAQGNPLAVREIIAAMLENGGLLPRDGLWRYDEEVAAHLSLPSGVSNLVTQRLRSLGPQAEKFLKVVAVAHGALTLIQLQQVSGLSEAEITSAREDCIRKGILSQTVEGGYQFVEGSLRDMLLGQLNPNELGVLHGQVAALIDAGLDQPDETSLFQLAGHYKWMAGVQPAARCAQVLLLAGRKSLERGAYELAYELLVAAEKCRPVIQPNLQGDILDVFAESSMRSGRLAESLTQIQEALNVVTDTNQRAMLRARRSWILQANGSTGAAQEEIEAAFREVRKVAPGSSVGSALLTMGIVGSSEFALASKRGHPKNDKRATSSAEHQRIMLQLYEHAGYVAFFRLDDLTVLQNWLRTVLPALKLPPSREVVFGYCQYSLAMLFLGRRAYAHRVLEKAAHMAEELGDRIAVARTKLYAAYLEVFSGNEIQAQSRLLEWRDEHSVWTDAWDTINGCACLIWTFLLRGHTKESAEAARDLLGRFEGKNISPSALLPTVTLLGAAQAILGHMEEADKLFAKVEGYYSGKEGNPWHIADHQGKQLILNLEKGELGKEIDEPIAAYERLAIPPNRAGHHNRLFYVFTCYARLAQVSLNPKDAEAQARLKAAHRNLKQAAHIDLLKAHERVIAAGVSRLEGKPEEALTSLATAEKLAASCDAPLVFFEALVERARIFRGQGLSSTANWHVDCALTLAKKHGWKGHVSRISKEFGISHGLELVEGTDVVVPEEIREQLTAPVENPQTKRRLESLLEVSLAVQSVLDPDEQAKVILDSIVRLMGAERGFIFLAEEKNGATEMILRKVRDANGADLDETATYSRTVVELVRRHYRSIVVAGTEEGELLGAKSVLALGLRSIICAPIMLKSEAMGVIYLDSRVAKGLFTNDDIQILSALANHVAISLEISRSARREIERQALEKDLQLTGAVQSLLLPQYDTMESSHVSLATSYRPMTHAGGDWWDVMDRGEERFVLLGDVTGHGPAAAMVTACVSSAINLLRSETQLTPEALLERLSDVVRKMAKGKYLMGLSTLVLNPSKGSARCYCAGSPPILLLRADGTERAISTPGEPLGSGGASFTCTEIPISPGDRFMLLTDGVTELVTQRGRQLGLKGALQALKKTRGLQTQEARNSVSSSLSTEIGDSQPTDDVTFIIVDVSQDGTSNEAQQPSSAGN